MNPLLCEECGGAGHRARPSAAKIEVVMAMHQGMPEEEKQTHFSVPHLVEDSEFEAILGMLARESS